jgi:hypothetical protein
VSTVCAVHLGTGADLAVDGVVRGWEGGERRMTRHTYLAVDGVVAFGGELGSVHLLVGVWSVWCVWECMVWMGVYGVDGSVW